MQVIQNAGSQTAAELAAQDASIAEEPLKLPEITGVWLKVRY
jgi:hypothetical protein